MALNNNRKCQPVDSSVFRQNFPKTCRLPMCDPGTMKPICGVELDDISHTSKKSYARDLFVEKVYNDANFELIRLSSKYTYKEIETALTGVFNRPQEIPEVQIDNETVLCPKCSIPMVLRKSTKGQNAGKEFYGCTNYPQCKHVINVTG